MSTRLVNTQDALHILGDDEVLYNRLMDCGVHEAIGGFSVDADGLVNWPRCLDGGRDDPRGQCGEAGRAIHSLPGASSSVTEIAD